MKEIIQFSPLSGTEGVFDPPVPAKTVLPEWYKKQQGYVGGEKTIQDDGSFNHTIKHCMPVFDAMSSGYIMPLPQDLEIVGPMDGDISIRWPSDILQVSSHSVGQLDSFPLNHQCWEPAAWKFHSPWIVKTPPGYSCLFTAPMWHEDIPFKCLSGVVDTDTYNMHAVNFPFIIRKGFRGAVPLGTPMIQIIPFKRTDWESEILKESIQNDSLWHKSKRRFGHRYKKDYRQTKEYK